MTRFSSFINYTLISKCIEYGTARYFHEQIITLRCRVYKMDNIINLLHFYQISSSSDETATAEEEEEIW